VLQQDSLSPVALWRIVNIGNSNAVQLTDFIAAIEEATGRMAERNLMPMQAGDVPATWADASLLKALTGYSPKTSITQGVTKFVEWYREYYQN
jgi:UDP-glucuronate 4-epimerase